MDSVRFKLTGDIRVLNLGCISDDGVFWVFMKANYKKNLKLNDLLNLLYLLLLLQKKEKKDKTRKKRNKPILSKRQFQHKPTSKPKSNKQTIA